MPLYKNSQGVIILSLSDKKLESQQQCRLNPANGPESNDYTDIFSLPQYVRVMVSNYQPLQTVFAIDKGECQSEGLKKDEQFSPTVTIVDTATNQPLDCVLLLHGEKPPEVNCRTLFCYIAVQVSYRDVYGSHPYPLYHVESEPCKQGKLSLTCCFHQPGTVCNIQLSIHSIVDSEGVEYMYNSEDCDCNVQVIDRSQHVMRVQHGVVRIEEPPRLRYTGPLATKQFHKLERLFTELFQSPGHNRDQILRLCKRTLAKTSSGTDIKAYTLCWKASSVDAHRNYEQAEKALRKAWKRAAKLECENGLLLQGKVLKHLAFLQYIQRNDDKALEYISRAKSMLILAAPFNETAHTLHTELLIKSRRLLNGTFSSEMYTSTEREYDRLLEHAKYMEEYDKIALYNFHTVKASFHLRSKLITNKLPSMEYHPSSDDLRKADECLKSVSLDIMLSQSNLHKARHLCTACDLCIWKHEYTKAMYYLEEARKLYEQTNLNPVLHKLDQRLQLLESLTENDKQDEILGEHSDTP